MLQAAVAQHGQGGSQPNAVIRAQGGATGFDPLAIDPRLDRIFGEVMDGIIVLLRHHIQMRLQGNGFAVFKPRRGGFTDQNIAGFIALVPQPPFSYQAGNIIRQLLFMPGRMRDRTNCGKDIPQGLRGESG